MNNHSQENTNKIDWKEIILCLQSFTRSFTRGKQWFRGGNTSTFLKGKEIDDYVYGAIEKYLHNPEKYNPKEGSLVDYLKFNIIRTLVGNDLKSKENKTSEDDFFLSKESEEDEINSISYLDKILPVVSAYLDEEMDYIKIMYETEKKIQGDKLLEQIFTSTRRHGMKRRNAIKELEISEKEFDNGMRRLKTILSSISKKYGIKK